MQNFTWISILFNICPIVYTSIVASRLLYFCSVLSCVFVHLPIHVLPSRPLWHCSGGTCSKYVRLKPAVRCVTDHMAQWCWYLSATVIRVMSQHMLHGTAANAMSTDTAKPSACLPFCKLDVHQCDALMLANVQIALFISHMPLWKHLLCWQLLSKVYTPSGFSVLS